MRPVVIATAVWFDPRLAWVRAPIAGVARRAGGVVMRWLDQRRERVNGLH